jgi:mRNA-degrading endonuclease HigB of HigAB toxin-antitoxin module
MVVISYGTLRAFYGQYPGSEDALNNWYRATLVADWSNYHEIKKFLILLMQWAMIVLYSI